eukprot:jgi/Psemu1/37538/gm1.37538_g
MTETAVSWNEARGIHFSIGPNFTAGNRQSDLNAVFSRILPNIASLFLVDDDGVETLRPDPIPVLKCPERSSEKQSSAFLYGPVLGCGLQKKMLVGSVSHPVIHKQGGEKEKREKE